MALTLAIDVLSMITGMSVVTDYENWHDGTFMDVAEILGGKAMTTVFVFGAAVSVIGLLCTLLCSSSRIIYGMAMVGTLPKVREEPTARREGAYIWIRGQWRVGRGHIPGSGANGG
eukprot:8731624-Pyramimonas_sp.AAC.1